MDGADQAEEEMGGPSSGGKFIKVVGYGDKLLAWQRESKLAKSE